MSIMDGLFRTAATPGSTTGPNGAQVSVAPPQATAPTQPAAGTPPQPTEKTPDVKEDSPLDAFSSLWKNNVDKNGKPIIHSDPLANSVFNLDPAKVQEQARSLDFVKDINPDLLAKATAGGAEAGAALLEILNTVQQNAFAAGTLTSSKLINDGMATNNQNLRKALPVDIRRQTLATTPVSEEHRAVLEHPAVTPLVKSLRTVAFNKDPNANPHDVAATVDNYILGLAEAINAIKKPEAAGTQQAVDWESYFN